MSFSPLYCLVVAGPSPAVQTITPPEFELSDGLTSTLVGVERVISVVEELDSGIAKSLKPLEDDRYFTMTIGGLGLKSVIECGVVSFNWRGHYR